jgi:hypothetical protein
MAKSPIRKPANKLNRVPSGHKDFRTLMDEQIENARKALDVSLNPDDPELSDQMTLGGHWDDPAILSTALDLQPLYYARWATLLRSLRRERDKLLQIYSVWESDTKERITQLIYDANVKKGMTPSNSRPTQQQITDKFNSQYVKKGKAPEAEERHNIYNKYRLPLDKAERQIDIVEVVVKAFEMRSNTLIALAHLLRNMIDKGLVAVKLPTGKQSNH